MVRPPSFEKCSSNLAGTPAAGTIGTAVTVNANDAVGANVQLLAALTHDVEYLVIRAAGYNVAGGNGGTFLNVLWDPAGGTSYQTLIPNLAVGQSLITAVGVPFPIDYHFPIWIPAGSTVAVNGQTAHTSNITTGRVAMFAHGAIRNPGSWWCGQKVTAIGADAATTQGTSHTAGSTGTYSSWTNFGSVLPQAAGAFQFMVQGGNQDTTQNAQSYFFEFGISSQRIGPTYFHATTTGEAGWCSGSGPIFYNAPAGAQMMVRGTAGSATIEQQDVLAYAVH